MPVTKQTIDEDRSGQRLDNYLLSVVKGVPKSRIYRAIRGGEVRINGKRAKPESRLVVGDEIRIPPFRQGEALPEPLAGDRLTSYLESRILFEDSGLIVINKPVGLPVHGGSQVALGVIEALRQMRPKTQLLELVHRLDKGTSGCLLIAKKRRALLTYQSLLREQQMTKRYWLLVQGQWQGGMQRCTLPLRKNILSGGERMVCVDRQAGKTARTDFKPLRVFKAMTLLEATLHTGRTHQIRVHAASLGYPIAGDEKYGDRAFNQAMKRLGLNRMFLQCMEMSCFKGDHCFGLCALLDKDLALLLDRL